MWSFLERPMLEVLSHVLLFVPAMVAFRQEILLWKQMKSSPTTIIIESPQTIEKEQNSFAHQAESKEDTIIVGQQQNSLDETHKSFFAYISNKSERGQDYGIL
jgi:hypothetical protein